jgi:hypothetical protein
MPRGVHPASLANLRRGNATPSTKPRKPRWNNTPEFAAKMSARRRELAEKRRLERERLAAQPVESVEPVPNVERVAHVNDVAAVTERLEDFMSTPFERRTVTVYDEYSISMVPHGSTRRRVVGRPQVSGPFVRRNAVARYPVVRASVGHGIGWRPVYWQPELDVVVTEAQLDRIVTPDTEPSDGELRAAKAAAQYGPSALPRAFRTGGLCDLLGKSTVAPPGMGERERRYPRVPWDREASI